MSKPIQPKYYYQTVTFTGLHEAPKSIGQEIKSALGKCLWNECLEDAVKTERGTSEEYCDKHGFYIDENFNKALAEVIRKSNR